MELQLREIQKYDQKKAMQLAITGMHFNWYLDSPFLLNLYSRYFWYLELSRATQVIAAYADGEFAGILLADMQGEQAQYRSAWKSLYVKVFDVLQKTFYKDGAGLYEETNSQMLNEFLQNNSPDGEITFLAADPDSKANGIGSALVAELAQREPGKLIYLHTDDACTYQFYEHRGFQRACERDIVLNMGCKKVPLKCFIFYKNL